MRRIVLVAACALMAIACKRKALDADAGPALSASVDLGPALAPPPLRAATPPVPPLPALPKLAGHAAATAPPASAPIAGDPGNCRRVWTGSGVAPLVCTGSSLNSGSQAAGARALIAYSQLSSALASLPAVVDHRVENVEGPVRNQTTVPACTAFAIAAAVDHSIARWTGTPAQVSVMQIWSRYHEPEEHDSILMNLGHDLGAEERWPFAVIEATSWLPCTPGQKPGKAGCGNPVDAAHLAKVTGDPIASFRQIERVDPTNVLAMKLKLAAGQDIVVAMTVPDTFTAVGKAGAKYVPNYANAPKDSGHAMLLAGYASFSHGTYFLVHNSWGKEWGDGGYAWLHEATVAKWTKDAAIIGAEPRSGASAVRAQRGRGQTTCDAGLVPDSIRGTCAPPCADGSPRHAGVCAVAGQCPASYVNLTGSCVLAAPTSTGVDPATGIRYACGPGGCAYTLPRTVDAACTGNSCMASCPAPDYRVAKAGGEVTCVE